MRTLSSNQESALYPKKWAVAYPFEITVDDILGVHVLETYAYIHQLGRVSQCSDGRQGETNQLEPIHITILDGIITDIAISHPRGH